VVAIFLTVIVAVACVIVLVVWLAGFLFASDISVPNQPIDTINRALVIFPHPDDETNVAGTLWRLHSRGKFTSLAVLTRGERGTPDAHLNAKLKLIRAAEMQKACRVLGISKYIQADFGDGMLHEDNRELRTFIDSIIREINPDLVITYDLAGLYGHPDHIACARLVSNILSVGYPHINYWRVAFPQRLLTLIHLPEHMASDPHFRKDRAIANRKLFIGLGVIAKVNAVYTHKSQRQSFRRSTPYHLPLWFAQSVRMFEYFEAPQSKVRNGSAKA